MMPPNKVKIPSPIIQIIARVEYKYMVDYDVVPCSGLLGIGWCAQPSKSICPH